MGYRKGYDEGHDEGLSLGRAIGERLIFERLHAERKYTSPKSGIYIDVAIWRRLLQVCHPDRNSSPAAVAVTFWLNAVRDRVSP